ncbi:MAG: hypothetical protein P8172_06345 [Gammaproteobacteria bacterium]|jgi:hypothetical protein
MSIELYIVIGLLLAGAVYLVIYIRAMMRRSEEQWQAADKSKLRTWEEDEDEEELRH